MGNQNPDQEGIKGAIEDMKGRAKETLGTFLGNDEMGREGDAQQEKGEAQQTAAEKEAEAAQAEREAGAAETRERSQQ